MAEKFLIRADSTEDAQQIADKRVEDYKMVAFGDAHPDFSENNRRDYFAKIILSPISGTNLTAYSFCPDFPKTSSCQLLFVVSSPEAEKNPPSDYFVMIYVDEEAKRLM